MTEQNKRGFESFQAWAKANREGARYWRSAKAKKDHPNYDPGEHELAAIALDREYEKLIKPNL